MSTEIESRDTDLDETTARELVARIDQGLAQVWSDVQTAYHGRAWLALGYASWDELCAAEFDTARLRLPREERQEVVASLRESGMSMRAIGAAVGTDAKTVRNDLATGENSPVEATITGLNGKQYQPSKTSPAEVEVLDAELVDEPGASGEPGGARRRPITETADDAGWEIRRAADKIARLLDDDRFPRNGDQVALALRGHLQQVAATVADALAALEPYDQ